MSELMGKGCCIPSLKLKQRKQSAAFSHIADQSWQTRCINFEQAETIVGTSDPKIIQDGEGPSRKVKLKPYLCDPYCVTNAWFAEFIDSTGYITDAERYGWSLVFWSHTDKITSYQRVKDMPWWCKVDGAMWAKPNGLGSSVDNLSDHPVTHVSWNDANAFAKWAGARLPTEAEWEHAARGDIHGAIFPWGLEDPTDAKPLCNIWQGEFPHKNTVKDGYEATAPVNSFTPNQLGIFNMVGNVWEWCSDPFIIRSQKKQARHRNAAARANGERLAKGGSYLCHKSYCYRYRIAARTGLSANSSAGHLGFRLVV